MHPGVIHTVYDGLLADDFHRRIHLSFRCFLIIIFAQICILIDVHIHPCHVIDGKTGISGRQTVFMDIKAVQLNLGRHAQADRFVNDLKDDKHHDQHIRRHAYDTERLNPKLLKAAAPDPVSGDRIYHQADRCAVDAIRFEVCPLRHGSGDDRRRCRTEHGLENSIAPCRKRAEIICSPDQGVKASDQRT